MSRPRGIKKFAVDKSTVCHPDKAQFVINGRGRGHCCVESCFPAILPPEVARRTAIALIVG